MGDDCPDVNTLNELASGCLDASMRAGIVAHLDACTECRRLVALAVASLEELVSVDPWEAPPRIGTRVGPYVIEEALGSGAMGLVYAARHERLGRSVALKLARPSPAARGIMGSANLASRDAESLFRLKQEFGSLANLEHENVVRLEEFGCDGGRWFFTMERVHGTDFLKYVAGDRPVGLREGAALEADEERRLRRALAQLVEALSVVHGSGRIHRDVKPTNVMVTSHGRVVLLDFGLVAGFGIDERAFGTPAFMAPEQIAGEELTPAADWYAVGVMLFAAVTGRTPFAGDAAEVLQKKLTAEAPKDWGPSAPGDLRAIGTAMLQRDPLARPQVDELRARLGLAPRRSDHTRHVFVGRESELRRLQKVAADAAAGRATALLVRGEPGIGKSALVERFLSTLTGHVSVLRGCCYEQRNVPFGGVDSLVDALSEYLLGLDPQVLERVAGTLSNAARVFPVLRRVPEIATIAVEEQVVAASTLPEPAFGELARLVCALTESGTLVVFVDDLQWIDADGLALIRTVFLSRDARCLFVATLRSGGVLSSELAEIVASAEIVDLQPLTQDESLAMWSAVADAENTAMRDALFQEAGGHPFLIAELAGGVRSGAHAPSRALRIEDVLWERISKRDEIERRFLEMVALAAAPTPDAILAQAGGLGVGEALSRVSGLRAGRLIRVSRVGDERCVEPYHDRIREAVMEGVRRRGETEVAKLHASLGRTLRDATDEAMLPFRIFSIVHHMNLGRNCIDTPDERKRLAELNLLASHKATMMTAFELARQCAAAGLECLRDARGESEARLRLGLAAAAFRGPRRGTRAFPRSQEAPRSHGKGMRHGIPAMARSAPLMKQGRARKIP